MADQLFRASAPTITQRVEHGPAATSSTNSRIAVEKSDESFFWLVVAGRSVMNQTADRKELLADGRELLAIFIQTAKTASQNNRQ